MQPAIALAWLARGRTPIPVIALSKRPAVPWQHYQHSRPSEARVMSWFTKRRDYNLGLLCDETHVVLDFDDLPSGVRWRARNPSLAATYTVRTGRGLHVYLDLDAPIKTHMASEAMQLKASGYVVGEHSLHPSGASYVRLGDERRILTVSSQALLASLEPFGLSSIPSKAHHSETGLLADVKARLVEEARPLLTMVQEIRQALPIGALLAQYTTPRRSSRDGRWLIMRCPSALHPDKHPSFWADAHGGHCGCFSPRCQHTQPSGGRAMDVINAYSWLNGLSNGDAIRELWRWLHGDEWPMLAFNAEWGM